LSLSKLLNHPTLVWILTLGGVAFLLFLAFQSFRSALRGAPPDPVSDTPASVSHHGAYFTGLLMTLLNPMTLAFWFLAVPAAVGTISKEPSHELPMLCIGVFIGTLAWVVTFSGLLAWAGQWRKTAWLTAADAVGGAVLFCFAMIELWRALRPHL
jgi:threonine/homoserine/homoserine lactone efflux protein